MTGTDDTPEEDSGTPDDEDEGSDGDAETEKTRREDEPERDADARRSVDAIGLSGDDPTGLYGGSGVPDELASFLEEDVSGVDDETLPKNVVRILDDQSRFTGGDPKILIACMGNILRSDDGFGVAVARELEARDLPPNVEITEVGISGVSMAQDMMSGYDAMVLVDAMAGGEEAGTIYVERAEVPDIEDYDKREIGSFAADMHQTDPSKVLILGQALGVLPEPTIFVGCEPVDAHELDDEMSEPVRKAVPEAVEHIETIVAEIRDMELDEAATDD